MKNRKMDEEQLKKASRLSNQIARLLALKAIADLSSRGYYPKATINWLKEDIAEDNK